jgi:hypothetical protein
MINKNSGYGQFLMNQIAASVGPIFGKVHVVISTSDEQYKINALRQLFDTDTDGMVRFFTSLEDAYDACTSNADDVILLSGYAEHVITTGIAWSKSRIHVIGMDGGHRINQQGAKIKTTVGAAVAYVIKVTGTRNTFENIKFIQNDTNAAAINVVISAGEGTRYTNCSFIFEVADNLDLTTASELLVGEDSGLWENCSFGTDVLLTSAARNVTSFDTVSGSASGDSAKSNRFVDCEWIVMSSTADAVLLKVIDTAGAKFLNSFVRPRFAATINATNVAIAITNAVQSVASFVEGTFAFYWPVTANCTNFCDTLNAKFMVCGTPAVSSNGFEGVAPA